MSIPVDTHQNTCHQINLLMQQKVDLENEMRQSEQVAAQNYSNLNHWDACVNYLPGGSYLTSNPYAVNQYNTSNHNAYLLKDQVNQVDRQIQTITQGIYRQMVMVEKNNPLFSRKVQSLQILRQLQGTLHQSITMLRKAENSEWWDGATSDTNTFGAVNDFESRRDNMNVASILQDLNYQIRRYNELILVGHISDFAMKPLPTLTGASESIMNAEMNENHPLYQMSGSTGDWWGSRNTLNVLKQVRGDVEHIAFEVNQQTTQIEGQLYTQIQAKRITDAPSLNVPLQLERDYILKTLY